MLLPGNLYRSLFAALTPNTYTACAQLQSLYHVVPISVVEKFVSLCQLRKPQLSTAPLKPILANGFFCRLQVHIIVYCICSYVHIGEI